MGRKRELSGKQYDDMLEKMALDSLKTGTLAGLISLRKYCELDRKLDILEQLTHLQRCLKENEDYIATIQAEINLRIKNGERITN